MNHTTESPYLAEPPRLLPVGTSAEALEQVRAQMCECLAERFQWGAPLVLGGDTEEAALIERTREADALVLVGNMQLKPCLHLLARVRKPAMLVEPSLAFHPFQADVRHQMRRHGLAVLPAEDPALLDESLRALSACRWLGTRTVLAVEAASEGSVRTERARELDAYARDRLGVQIVRRPVEDLTAMADAVADATARETLAGWRETVFGRIDETLPEAHLLDLARLYTATKAMLTEVGANAVTLDDFGGFLRRKRAMPNVPYALLKNEGIVCAEECDIGAVLSQLLLASVSRTPVAMSNIYLAWRDAFDACPSAQHCPPAAVRDDYLQCLRDGCAVITHYSTAGILPLAMTEGDRYDIVETRPSWPGQSMVYTVPKKGPVLLARLWDECEELDVVRGEVVEVIQRPDRGWYRCRWLVRLADMPRFVQTAVHHHYAIGPDVHLKALQVLTGDLLRIPVGLQ